MRCTQATLEALGISGKCPTYGTGVIDAIQKSGRRIKNVDCGYGIGLRSFIEAHAQGSFYLWSDGHAMALVNGTLTDTSERRISNRIKVLGAVEIK